MNRLILAYLRWVCTWRLYAVNAAANRLHECSNDYHEARVRLDDYERAH